MRYLLKIDCNWKVKKFDPSLKKHSSLLRSFPAFTRNRENFQTNWISGLYAPFKKKLWKLHAVLTDCTQTEQWLCSWALEIYFKRGKPKVVGFNSSISKLRKRPFFCWKCSRKMWNFKIRGERTPLLPPDAHDCVAANRVVNSRPRSEFPSCRHAQSRTYAWVSENACGVWSSKTRDACVVRNNKTLLSNVAANNVEVNESEQPVWWKA